MAQNQTVPGETQLRQWFVTGSRSFALGQQMLLGGFDGREQGGPEDQHNQYSEQRAYGQHIHQSRPSDMQNVFTNQLAAELRQHQQAETGQGPANGFMAAPAQPISAPQQYAEARKSQRLNSSHSCA